MSYVKDDRRYMTFEERAVEDHSYRGKLAPKGVETCHCGKTVVAVDGRATGVTCPRECHA